MSESPLDPLQALGLDRLQLPRHVAVIMDGNGRWAQQRGQPRIRGHEQGAHAVRTIVTRCARLGLEALTLYSFSTENWKRPREEVDFLMQLYVQYLRSERPTIMDNNVRFVHVGRRAGLPDEVLAEMDETLRLSADNTGLKVCLALNYGGRGEIVDAVQHLAREVQAGALAPDDIDEDRLSSALYTAGLPDPDLLIRTAGERRLSNFLLWQVSYAELHITETLWPDFGEADLDAAIKDFAQRKRRYGGVAGDPSQS